MKESEQLAMHASSALGTWVWVPELKSHTWLLSELLEEIRKRRTRLLVAFVSAGLLVFAASFLLSPTYRSTAIVLAVGSNQSAPYGGVLRQLSGLAGIAGIAAPSVVDDRATISLATLSSRTFLVKFAKRHGMVESLFSRRFNRELSTWRTGLLYGDGPPTDDEIFEEVSSAVSVTRDELTGLVTIDVDASSATLAYQWNQALIRDLNEQLRLQDIKEAERSVAYLETQIAKSTVQELNQMFYRLIEEWTKTAMLAHVSAEYAFKTVDPASLPDEPFRPRRFALAFLSAVAAFIIYFAWTLLRFAFRPIANSP